MEQNFDAFELEYAQDYFTWALPKDTSAYTPREAGEFDKMLVDLWNKAKKDGAFRYDLNVIYKSTPGKYGFTSQLNCERAQQRRKPHHFKSITDPFDPRRFNFTKIKQCEVLMKLTSKDNPDSKDSYVIVNSSPLGVGHCLLIPSLFGKQPQVLTSHSIRLAVEMMLISQCRLFHIVFNSILGMASVNHLHLHLYYWPYESRICSWATKLLCDNVYLLDGWVIPAFVVQLNDKNIDRFVETVSKITQYFNTTQTPHNIFMSRSVSLVASDDTKDLLYPTIYLFPRKPLYGTKPLTTISPAACEFGGQLLVYSTWFFQEMTEEKVVRVFEEDAFLESDRFDKISADVKDLFKNCHN